MKTKTIYVFGSNTQGRHGKGMALECKNKHGAIYGQARGLQGNSYAIVTKDLTKRIHPSVSKEFIIEQIGKLYHFANQHLDWEFIIPYGVTGNNLNNYSSYEMAKMFTADPVPPNIVFKEGFIEQLKT